MTLSAADKESLRQSLCALQRATLEAILNERANRTTDQLAAITEETAADVIYAIDSIADQAIFNWFENNWSAEWP
ncbi:MAG TPA: hypothetical protein DCR32_06730, partial [Opitutae bacterium]|nr:hypothetical protein [Opitutae bacterium]